MMRAVLLALGTITILGIAGIWGTQFANAQSRPIERSTPIQLALPQPPKDSCGGVNAVEGNPPVVFNGQTAVRAEACFWRTYQQCQAKTLIFHQMGVDTGADNTLWPIKQKGKCYIADLVTYYVIPQGSHSSFLSYTKLQRIHKGLLLSGGGENANLLVPVP